MNYSGEDEDLDYQSSFSEDETIDDRGVVESPTFKVTDLLTSLGEKNQDVDYLVTKGNDLVILLQEYPYIKEDLVFSAFGHRIQTLLVHNRKEVIATGYRICRYFVSDIDSIRNLMALRLDVLIIISLAKGTSHDIEREQALKLIRKFLEIENGASELTLGITNAIQAIAEQIDENLKNICIETMCEISLLRPDLIRPDSLIQFIIDGPYELSSLCSTVFLAHLDSPNGRHYINKSDILRIISPFTEFPVIVKGKLNISHERLQINSIVLSKFIKNFAGIYGFSIDNFEPLKNLISCLSYPINSVVSKLLDLFLDVLMIKKTSTHNKKFFNLTPLKLENEFILSTHYLSLLITIFLNCGIIERLLDVVKKSNDERNCTKAAFLLTEIFNLSNNLVPNEITETFIGNIPNFKPDSSIENNVSQQLTNLDDSYSAIHTIEKLSRKLNKGRANWGLQGIKTTENFIQFSKNSKDQLNLKIDDLKLKQLIQDSRVLTTKSFTRWNCDILTDLFKGPFMNGKRLEEVNKTTKFIKRLLSFYRPFKHKFSGTKKTRQSTRFIRLGCTIVETLITTNEGLKILSDGKIIPQIAECLAQVDPHSGFIAKDQIFSKERLESTLTSGYFKILGILSANESGNKLLEQWKIFSIMHHISDDHFKRDDLVISFIDEIKFTKQGHTRILFSKFLHSPNKKIKIHTTLQIPKLLDDSYSNKFACEMLINQLYDHDEEVVTISIDILNKYCESSEKNLNQVISLTPSIPILKNLGPKGGNDLLMKFLSTPDGFKYLNGSNFINEELESWVFGSKYLKYVLELEKLLFSIEDSNLDYIKTKNLPSNFFAELVKSEEGFNVILRSGALTEFMNVIRYYATTLDRPGGTFNLEIDYLKTKASLWTIGFIGSSSFGIESLDVNGSIEDIVEIAKKSPYINLRGTAFYVLGLISKTNQGIEILDDLGWNSKLDVFNQSIGIAMPNSLEHFILDFHESNDYKINNTGIETNLNLLIDPSEIDDEILNKILKLIGDLCNHVLLNSATKELTTLSKKHQEYFEDPNIFFKVLKYFEIFKYRYTIRKFVVDLFISNGRLLEVISKRDRRRIRERNGHSTASA
ncbi:Target of rapamycin complex 2 subunit [Wickerhamomyces ciferrii]|uniref:Target of rapamycin complex 2 subunit n=1 Tax=Wickerhamomyces ciferrii (strain ATCC 14091 / BCRC 22168 / CBS 111 / JCM 3599 / NBRC 0793 / NRRL Y-1031 F-60-10) TaxID=1206466 RepID=K0KUT1_WICCF|nr:Target of rapamycin complex 2 subunit [Wickerhamomyces ciferrii]CCH45189.1 Target of rapamycin complex 2 subunit [Wickerhamomyces ciferrii]